VPGVGVGQKAARVGRSSTTVEDERDMTINPGICAAETRIDTGKTVGIIARDKPAAHEKRYRPRLVAKAQRTLLR